MTLEQVGLQLGIAGLLLVVVYRIAILLITRHSASEDKKTVALTQGLAQIASSVQSHSIADLESHAQLRNEVARFDGKLDEILSARERSTPVQGVPIVPLGEWDDEPSTPVESPRGAERQQRGTRVIKPRGPYLIRPKNNGKDE